MLNMTKFKEFLSKEKAQFLVIIALSIGAVGLTAILYFSTDHLFQRFIGRINPLAAALLLAGLGCFLLAFLLSKGWFAIYKQENLKGMFRISGFALLFVSITILVDLKAPFSSEINILFPESLLFYPAIGFFSEILFHVLPLTVLLIVLPSIFNNKSHKTIFWISILVVALVEPIYQVMPMSVSNQFPLWAIAVVGLNLFLFDLTQLLIFKRYDFISMYAFRLVYYLIWHILWGYLRLKLPL
jgi:hypothetical protein